MFASKGKGTYVAIFNGLGGNREIGRFTTLAKAKRATVEHDSPDGRAASGGSARWVMQRANRGKGKGWENAYYGGPGQRYTIKLEAKPTWFYLTSRDDDHGPYATRDAAVRAAEESAYERTIVRVGQYVTVNGEDVVNTDDLEEVEVGEMTRSQWEDEREADAADRYRKGE